MLDIIDTTDAADCLLPEFPPAFTESQNQLGEAITTLWVAHSNAKIMSRATNEELRSLRAKLGKQLSEMKTLLAKPGRGGQWSSFLMERNIPRATADRLAARHLRSLDPNANRVTEELSEPTDEDVQKIFNSVWPRLRRVLRTPQSLDHFIGLLTACCQCGGEVTESRNPGSQARPADALCSIFGRRFHG